MPKAPVKLPALEWRQQASADLMDIVAFIAEDNPDAAQELKDEIEDKAARLPRHPKLYRRSQRVKGTREVVIRSNYVVGPAECVFSADRLKCRRTARIAASAPQGSPRAGSI